MDGRKLVGSAQLRDGGALLQHGSILVEDDQRLIPPLLANEDSKDSLPGLRAAATMSSILGRQPSATEVADALFAAVTDLEDETADILAEHEIRSSVLARAAEFENELWTWRR